MGISAPSLRRVIPMLSSPRRILHTGARPCGPRWMRPSAYAGAMSRTDAPKCAAGLGAIVSWARCDSGSACFNAVIVTFGFAPYLTSRVAATEEAGSQALGWSTATAGLVIALVASAAGTRADASGCHRFWLG